MARRRLVRLLGWLLTPLVALLASFLGAWLGAGIGAELTSSTAAAWIMLGIGALAGIVAAWAWLRLVRRSPKLQHALEVAPDGTPLAAIEEETEGAGGQGPGASGA
ncbi:MAG: hypothetical protein ACT4PM_01485 [Gemmatimonadales bacterium]